MQVQLIQLMWVYCMHKYVYSHTHTLIYIAFITIIRVEWNMTHSCFILKKKWAQDVVSLYSDRTDIVRKAKPALPTLATLFLLCFKKVLFFERSKATSSKTRIVILLSCGCDVSALTRIHHSHKLMRKHVPCLCPLWPMGCCPPQS